MQVLENGRHNPGGVLLLYEMLAACDDAGAPGSELATAWSAQESGRSRVLLFALDQGLIRGDNDGRMHLTAEGQGVLDHLCEVADLLHQLEDNVNVCTVATIAGKRQTHEEARPIQSEPVHQ